MTTTDPHLLTLTAYPPGPGPYERWEVTTPTGEVVISGSMPIDEEALQKACQAYHVRIENEARLKASEESATATPWLNDATDK
jgi:hypothetical protein